MRGPRSSGAKARRPDPVADVIVGVWSHLKGSTRAAQGCFGDQPWVLIDAAQRTPSSGLGAAAVGPVIDRCECGCATGVAVGPCLVLVEGGCGVEGMEGFPGDALWVPHPVLVRAGIAAGDGLLLGAGDVGVFKAAAQYEKSASHRAALIPAPAALDDDDYR